MSTSKGVGFWLRDPGTDNDGKDHGAGMWQWKQRRSCFPRLTKARCLPIYKEGKLHVTDGKTMVVCLIFCYHYGVELYVKRLLGPRLRRQLHGR
jgi:hypothetical protein